MATSLMRIEALRQSIADLNMPVKLMYAMREEVDIDAAHYSTLMSGNQLSRDQVQYIIQHETLLDGLEQESHEVLCYYLALQEVNRMVENKKPIDADVLHLLHYRIHSTGRFDLSVYHYRNYQTEIRDANTGAIKYLPPAANDVPQLIADLLAWVKFSEDGDMPCPLRAAIMHYQIATIQPYEDGNGRLARLLSHLVIQQTEYGLGGIYTLDDYYANEMNRYFSSLSIGPSYKYYLGRAEADISSWLLYYCNGMIKALEGALAAAKFVIEDSRMNKAELLRTLDQRQRKALVLFCESTTITSNQIATMFKLRPRTVRQLCRNWVEAGFLVIVDPARKSRRYALHENYHRVLECHNPNITDK